MTSPSPSTPVRSPRRPWAISLTTTLCLCLSASSTDRRPTTARATSRRVPPPSPMPSSTERRPTSARATSRRVPPPSPMPSSPSITTTPSTTTTTMPSRRPISSRPALGRSRRMRTVLLSFQLRTLFLAVRFTITTKMLCASRAAPSSFARPRLPRATSRATPSASRRLWKVLMLRA